MKTFPRTRYERTNRKEYKIAFDSYRGLDEQEIKKIASNTSQSNGWVVLSFILLVIFVILTIAIMVHGG